MFLIQKQPISLSRKFSAKKADAVGNGVWLMQKCYYCWGNYVYAHRTVESEMSNGRLDDSAAFYWYLLNILHFYSKLWTSVFNISIVTSIKVVNEITLFLKIMYNLNRIFGIILYRSFKQSIYHLMKCSKILHCSFRNKDKCLFTMDFKCHAVAEIIYLLKNICMLYVSWISITNNSIKVILD